MHLLDYVFLQANNQLVTVNKQYRTYPPKVAYFSVPSTWQHNTLPEPHIFQPAGESSAMEVISTSVLKDLIIAFPFSVHSRNLFALHVRIEYKES
jgi:hypothetical protein